MDVVYAPLPRYLLQTIAERCLGRRIAPKAQRIREFFALPEQLRLQVRNEQLFRTLEASGREVPYYRELFRRCRFAPAKVRRDLRYLHDVPYLTKEIIREQGERLLSRRVARRKLHVRKTGGSTGPSARIYYSGRGLDWTAAVARVALQWAGKSPALREVHISNGVQQLSAWDGAKERMKCVALNRVNVLTGSLGPHELDRIYRLIARAKPYLVHGHPSTLYALACHFLKQGIDATGLFRIFESTGELLAQKHRRTITRVFGCRVVDCYGNAEFGILAYERPGDGGGALKVFDCAAYPETIPRSDGPPELVFTGLLNEAMPLIRYRTGDRGELVRCSDGDCVRALVGRVHDLVPIGDSWYPTHFIQDLLDRIGNVDDFQIEIRRAAPLLLRLVVSRSDVQRRCREKIRQLWGSAVVLEFTDFDGLKRVGWRGKFSYLVADETVPRAA